MEKVGEKKTAAVFSYECTWEQVGGVDLGFDMSSANSRILPKKGGSGVLRPENLKSRSSLSGISFIFREFNYSKVQNKQVIKCCKNIIHTLKPNHSKSMKCTTN